MEKGLLKLMTKGRAGAGERINRQAPLHTGLKTYSPDNQARFKVS